MSLIDCEVDLSQVFKKVYVDESPQLIDVIRKFTFLWMCFDKSFISNPRSSSKNAQIKGFSRQYYREINRHLPLYEAYIGCARYFHERYQDPDLREKLGYSLNAKGLPNQAQLGLNQFFDGDFERILDIKKLECSLQIIYRFSCNLFDGKARDKGFGCQIENVKQANNLLYHLNMALLPEL